MIRAGSDVQTAGESLGRLSVQIGVFFESSHEMNTLLYLAAEELLVNVAIDQSAKRYPLAERRRSSLRHPWTIAEIP